MAFLKWQIAHINGVRLKVLPGFGQEVKAWRDSAKLDAPQEPKMFSNVRNFFRRIYVNYFK
jgi:hypothetical protein